jgi:hypothetical protein
MNAVHIGLQDTCMLGRRGKSKTRTKRTNLLSSFSYIHTCADILEKRERGRDGETWRGHLSMYICKVLALVKEKRVVEV